MDVVNYDHSYDSVAVYATGDWNSADSHVQFSASPNAANYIQDTYYGSNGYDGATYYYACTFGNISAISTWNRYYTDGYDNNGRTQVMVHELGHMLGLGHYGSMPCGFVPIMYYSSDRWFTCHKKTPQSDDTAGTRSLY